MDRPLVDRRAIAAVLTVLLAVTVSAVPTEAAAPPPELALVPVGTYRTGIFDQSAAEIAAHDPATQRLFVVNFAQQRIDVVSIADPTDPALVTSVALGGSPNGVDVFGGVVAVAVEAEVKIDPGRVVFLDTDGVILGEVEVGALPDSLAFTPDGAKVVVANEGEPLAGVEGDLPAYTSEDDPEGSISVIDISGGVEAATVSTATLGVPRVEVTGGVRRRLPSVG